MLQPDFKTDSDVVAIQPEANKLSTFARTLVIKTADGYNEAASFLKSIKGMLGKIEDARTRVTKPLNEALRQVNAQAKDASAPLQTAENQIKRAMIAYSDEQERLRREEQDRAEAAARKERERLEAQARKAEASGKVEKAVALEQRAASVVAPVIQREAPKVAGVVTREVWKFSIIDAAAVPREYLMVDETKIRKVVQALKGETVIAGVRVYPEKNLGASAA
jgi:hypothetical protein